MTEPISLKQNLGKRSAMKVETSIETSERKEIEVRSSLSSPGDNSVMILIDGVKALTHFQSEDTGKRRGEKGRGVCDE